MTEPGSLVSIRELRYRYPGATHDVLKIPFLDIGGSGLIAITGPSGAGKSTLVELLAGTLREDYEGSVHVLGEEWKDLRRDADRQRHLRRVGLIPQDFGLLPSRTPRETLMQDLADAETPRPERAERIAASLEAVGMEGMADRRIAGLSGGQRQRVAIARLLARDVDLVIADEPTANLDPELVATTMDLFRQLADRVPVLVVTHDPQVASLCDRTIVLQAAVPSNEAPSVAVATSAPRRGRRRATVLAVGVVAAGLAIGAVAVVNRSGAHPATDAQLVIYGFTRGLRLGSVAGASSVPIEFSWNENAKACKYELQTASKGTAYRDVPRPPGTANESAAMLTYGVPYTARVRAVTCSGVSGPWTALPGVTVTRIPSTDPAIAYSGDWSSSNGSVRSASSAGAAVSFTFDATNIAWLADIGKNGAKVTVQTDGQPLKHVNLQGATGRDVIVAKRGWEVRGHHTLTLQPKADHAAAVITVAGFLILN